jgi:subtilisin-like proprotein convertase family protein
MQTFLALLLAGVTAQAAVYSTSVGQAVPDGNPAGLSSTIVVSGMPGATLDVNVSLEFSGGYNGDLYAFLSCGSGFAVLLNRVGKTASDPFGYGDAGMNVTLNDQASQSTDIHLYQTVPGYSITGGTEWRPDGRNIDPLTVVGTDGRTALLSSFNGLNPNGEWTLFVADMAGGEISTWVSWGLNISSTPEPAYGALALGLFGCLFLAARRKILRRRNVRG